ncbi:MAG TPA: magnesium transporter CorA, partial [Treponema sp.]|nr:magnesium transporter CorA [Treponema sp.]
VALIGWLVIAKTSRYASPIVQAKRKSFQRRRSERRQRRVLKKQEKIAEAKK